MLYDNNQLWKRQEATPGQVPNPTIHVKPPAMNASNRVSITQLLGGLDCVLLLEARLLLPYQAFDSTLAALSPSIVQSDLVLAAFFRLTMTKTYYSSPVTVPLLEHVRGHSTGLGDPGGRGRMSPEFTTSGN